MINQNTISKPSGLPYTRYVNRKLGRLLALKLKMFTPNQVTVYGFFVFLFAVVTLFIFFGTRWVFVSYFLLAFNYALDSADGQIARLKNMQSKLGDWLDHCLDGLRLILLNLTFIILLFPYVLNEGRLTLQLLLCLPLVAQSTHYICSSFKVHILNQRIGHILDQNKESTIKLLLRWGAAPADFGVFLMITLLAYNKSLFLTVYILYGFYYLMILFVTSYMTIRSNIS